MKYVVFDLDLTMADLHSYFFPLIALRTPSSVPPEQLEHAYTSFVHRVLREEASAHPLGLLRPGLLAVMEELANRRRRREIHPVVIYSNNRYLPCLELVKDVINSYVGILLIDQVIHWDHPARLPDKMDPTFTKTWDTLKIILKRKTLSPAEVIFFDDQAHPHLKIVLGCHYRQVTPYHHASCFQRIKSVFLAALEDASVDHETMFCVVYNILAEGTKDWTWTELTLKGLMEEYEFLLGETATPHMCPVGHCSEFWDALQEYRPEWYLEGCIV
jgi:hypothetical protein